MTPIRSTNAAPTSTQEVAERIGFTLGAKRKATPQEVDAVSRDFESQFISQMLEGMFSTIDKKESLGGSEAEETYESLLVSEYGKVISRAGGVGIADQIKRQILTMQEVK